MMSKSLRSTSDSHAALEYIDGLYGYALLLTSNRSEAEDLVQETYLRAIAAMNNLFDGSNVKAWLFTIMRNAWFNQLRRRRLKPRIIQIDNDENTTTTVVDQLKNPYEAYESKLEAERVRNAIQQLPEDFREIIVLREYEDLSYQEIADVLDCPVGTVMSRLARARSKLRALLSVPPQRSKARIASKAHRMFPQTGFTNIVFQPKLL
jgi:RNA polymerase sigma-70 factor (ECF subfamily)